MVNDLKSAREFFAGDTYATETTGIEIVEAAEKYSKVRLKLGPGHMNAGGRVMGAVYFTMADFAFAVAANFERDLTVTVSSQINFLAQPKGDELYAEARCVSDGRRMCCYEVTVTDSFGTVAALVTSNGYRMAAHS